MVEKRGLKKQGRKNKKDDVLNVNFSDLNDKVFLRDLNFLMSLSSFDFLFYLSSSGILESDKFRKYLRRLEYFKKEPYIYAVVYYQSLVILDLLKDDLFIEDIKNEDKIRMYKEQQVYLWVRRDD